MSENNKNDFIGYEYKDINISREMEPVYADSYKSFGWELEGMSTPVGGINSITMKFKRNRKVRNKAELTRLQRQFDSLVGEVIALERSKVIKASVVAYIIGLIGTAFMAGSVFAIVPDERNVLLCVILAIPAFVGWIIPYFVYADIRRKKTEKAAPIIDSKYDEIYDVCERANSLLAN